MHYPDDVSDVTDPRGDLQWGTIPGLVEDAAARFGEPRPWSTCTAPAAPPPG